MSKIASAIVTMKSLFKRNKKPELIAMCVISGLDGQFLCHEAVAVAIKGERDPFTGQQRWYDTPETMRIFHPELE